MFPFYTHTVFFTYPLHLLYTILTQIFRLFYRSFMSGKFAYLIWKGMNSRVQNHNKEIMRNARQRSMEMNTWPSPLEERMKIFLEKNWIKFDFQKIFYIYADDGWIVKYYIADFFIPEANVIIEVDGKFHDKHKQHDRDRTKDIQNSYPGIEVLRFKWKDLSDDRKMNELLHRILK